LAVPIKKDVSSQDTGVEHAACANSCVENEHREARAQTNELNESKRANDPRQIPSVVDAHRRVQADE